MNLNSSHHILVMPIESAGIYFLKKHLRHTVGLNELNNFIYLVQSKVAPSWWDWYFSFLYRVSMTFSCLLDIVREIWKVVSMEDEIRRTKEKKDLKHATSNNFHGRNRSWILSLRCSAFKEQSHFFLRIVHWSCFQMKWFEIQNMKWNSKYFELAQAWKIKIRCFRFRNVKPELIFLGVLSLYFQCSIFYLSFYFLFSVF